MTDLLERPDLTVLDPALSMFNDDQLTELFDQRLTTRRRADHALLAVQAEIEARHMWGTDGVRNLAEWTAMRTGEGDRTARRHAHLARTLGDHPALADALIDGTLSLDHIRLLLTIGDLTDTGDRDLVDLGVRHSVPQLETILRATRRLQRRRHNNEHERRSLRWWVDDRGTFHLIGRLTGIDGLTVTQTLASIAEDSHPNPESGLHDPWDVRLADALVEVCTGPQGTVTESATVIIHAPLDALRTSDTDTYTYTDTDTAGSAGGADLGGDTWNDDWDADANSTDSDDDLPGVPQSSDGPVIANDPEGRTIGIGRRSRIIPYWLAQQVRWRDRTCRFPGCHSTRFTQCHHQRHWPKGGRTDLDNLILLCTHHHTLLHEGKWTLAGHPDHQLTFTSPAGRAFTTDPAPHHLRREPPRHADRSDGIDGAPDLGPPGELPAP
jgi:hypothetical protein